MHMYTYVCINKDLCVYMNTHAYINIYIHVNTCSVCVCSSKIPAYRNSLTKRTSIVFSKAPASMKHFEHNIKGVSSG